MNNVLGLLNPSEGMVSAIGGRCYLHDLMNPIWISLGGWHRWDLWGLN